MVFFYKCNENNLVSNVSNTNILFKGFKQKLCVMCNENFDISIVSINEQEKQ